MKRILEESPVKGYQLYRWQKIKADSSVVILPTYYIRHGNEDICTTKKKLSEAKIAVKRLAGDDTQKHKRLTASPPAVTVGALLDLVIEDYKLSGRKTLKDARGKINNGLRPHFEHIPAEKVNSDEIKKWMEWRAGNRLRKSSKLEQKTLSTASLNRELSILHRAFRLGYERNPQLVEKIPPIKKLAESNARKGFVTTEQYHALMEKLPEHLKAITCVAFHVANCKGELLKLEWSDVDLDGNPPVITLWPGETKNNGGRTLPVLPGEMLDTLRALKVKHDERYPKQAHVFLTADGRPLDYHHMRDDWDKACTDAGLNGLLFHDLRRSAVRNLRRAGVTQTVARTFSGHKTDSVFNRYNITDFDDLKDAAAKLGQYLKGGSDKK